MAYLKIYFILKERSIFFKNLLKKFQSSQEGAIAILTAFCALPMAILVFGLVDALRLSSAENQVRHTINTSFISVTSFLGGKAVMNPPANAVEANSRAASQGNIASSLFQTNFTTPDILYDGPGNITISISGFYGAPTYAPYSGLLGTYYLKTAVSAYTKPTLLGSLSLGGAPSHSSLSNYLYNKIFVLT